MTGVFRTCQVASQNHTEMSTASMRHLVRLPLPLTYQALQQEMCALVEGLPANVPHCHPICMMSQLLRRAARPVAGCKSHRWLDVYGQAAAGSRREASGDNWPGVSSLLLGGEGTFRPLRGFRRLQRGGGSGRRLPHLSVDCVLIGARGVAEPQRIGALSFTRPLTT